MDAGGWGLEGCIAVVKASRSKLRIHFKGCETLVTHRREKLTTVENQHILRKRPTATAKAMGKKANSGPEVYGKETGMALKHVGNAHFSLYGKCSLITVPEFHFLL